MTLLSCRPEDRPPLVDVFALIAEQAPGAFSVYDLAGNYRWVSGGFVGVLGYEPDDLVGRNAYDFIHPGDHEAGQLGHRRLFEQDDPVVVQCRLRAADGTYRWVETSSRLLRDQQVIVSTSRWVGSDQSAIEALQAERDLAARHRHVDEQHRQFLTAISHRARHPITIIRGMAELLESRVDAMDPDRCRELLTRIHSNARRLADLVEDVTQAERLARRTDRVQVRPLNLHELVRDVLAEVAHSDAPITVTVSDDTVVYGDLAMLRLALKALVDNAINHTPIDTPIWVRTSRVDEGTVISVEDGGPGVHPDLRDAIFDPFHRGDPDAPDPGLGLGLHAVAEVAAVHGGRVWVSDRDGGGAAFRILLPTVAAQRVRAQRDPATTGPDPAVGADSDQLRLIPESSIRVLVVDDDPVVTELMALTLQADGFHVDVAHDGGAALDLVTSEPPDLLVCDVRMPGMNGHELVRTIRSTAGISELPIVLCSGLTDDEDQWQSWRCGADSFVAKPFAPDHLVAEICRALGARAGQAGRPGPETMTRDA